MFCWFLGVGVATLRFLFDGKRINDDETPKQLEMEDNDTIEVYQEQVNQSFCCFFSDFDSLFFLGWWLFEVEILNNNSLIFFICKYHQEKAETLIDHFFFFFSLWIINKRTKKKLPCPINKMSKNNNNNNNNKRKIND